jgi:hypothetical protein
MADRPGLVRIMAAAFLAASVASSTAMPHWAAESAGASLTPDRGGSVLLIVETKAKHRRSVEGFKSSVRAYSPL